jgi:exodeoxyribonuclease VII small subunit
MENMTYSAAVAEIEDILRRMDSEQFDIDTMAAQVKRATELIKFCRTKLKKASDEVEQALG